MDVVEVHSNIDVTTVCQDADVDAGVGTRATVAERDEVLVHEQVPRAGDLLESVERLAKAKEAARVRGEVVNTLGQPDEDGLVEVEPCLRRGKLTSHWWTLYPRIAEFARSSLARRRRGQPHLCHRECEYLFEHRGCAGLRACLKRLQYIATRALQISDH